MWWLSLGGLRSCGIPALRSAQGAADKGRVVAFAHLYSLSTSLERWGFPSPFRIRSRGEKRISCCERVHEMENVLSTLDISMNSASVCLLHLHTESIMASQARATVLISVWIVVAHLLSLSRACNIQYGYQWQGVVLDSFKPTDFPYATTPNECCDLCTVGRL